MRDTSTTFEQATHILSIRTTQQQQQKCGQRKRKHNTPLRRTVTIAKIRSRQNKKSGMLVYEFRPMFTL